MAIFPVALCVCRPVHSYVHTYMVLLPTADRHEVREKEKMNFPVDITEMVCIELHSLHHVPMLYTYVLIFIYIFAHLGAILMLIRIYNSACFHDTNTYLSKELRTYIHTGYNFLPAISHLHMVLYNWLFLD